MGQLIVDGYNLLHAPGRYAAALERDIATARDHLIDDLASLAGEGFEITVVFDGAANPLADGEATRVGGISVVYSPSGIDADTIVEGMAMQATRAGREVMVVTSDTETANAVAGRGVRIVSAAGFLDELDQADAERRDSAPTGRNRTTVEDRLAGEVRAILLRMRRA